MAANKFARMLHKNCHKTVVVLVYAVLEWILILLLLLNSCFSYLIRKFSKYFGLKPSCPWCCRLDQIVDFKNVCEAHGTEISKLSYCSNHKRLAEFKVLCSDCSFSRPARDGTVHGISSTVAFLSWLSGSMSENRDQSRCSCCDEVLSRKLYAPSVVFKPSWDVLGYIKKTLSVADLIDAEDDAEQASETTARSKTLSQTDHKNHCDGSLKAEVVEDYCSSASVPSDENGGNACENLGSFEVQEWESNPTDFAHQPTDDTLCNEDDESVYITDMLLQSAGYVDSDRFICIELIDDTATASSQTTLTDSEEEHDDKQSNAEAEGTDNIPESEGQDCDKLSIEAEPKTTCPELDDCDQSVRAAVLSNSTNIELSADNKSNNQGMEECFDGSVISEMEVDDEGLTTEHLKATLKAQRKALHELYTELEEERKAAAVAANETMAMITKLQEEKSAMQMEALQYQRMMEEQAEYDQEALQLLNDLMMKREKEKQELEKELEMYRNKVLDYEAREKMTVARNTGDRSIDLDSEGEYDDISFDDTHQEHNLYDAPEETGGNFDTSLEEFEEERLCILEELKVLEAKIFALHENETPLSKDFDSCSHEENGMFDTSMDNKKIHFEGKTTDATAKKLLPLFDATDDEFGEEVFDKQEISTHNAGNLNDIPNGTELETSKVVLQEELGHVYERLQALEADKEFLKHCIRSMMKGNKGMALVQEILQHLRDLRSAELSARNLAEIPLADVSNED
ncbi:myosin-binding protein 3 [Sesamum indicum]|uniref:Myosin-binding protein 3 n=1 Tax=Sesamum indicum TaxID=4182 RepID=A0A6I9UCE8_SESIN|nr:myosin-binding protein 3 [Sesamum indicum]